MKRALISLLAALPLALAPGAAWADGPGDGPGQTGETTPQAYVVVAGTVVSVDSTGGSFTANAFLVPAPGHDGAAQPGESGWPSGAGGGPGSFGFGGSGHSSDGPATRPVTTLVTITPDASTKISLNHQSAGLGDLVQGDRFYALFNGSSTDTLDTVVASAPVDVFAKSAPKPRQLYAFVGTVTGVDATGGTVTVDVSRSLPSDLVPAGSPPVQFTVDDSTLILGGGLGGSLSNVSVGDVVAGGLTGDSGLTLSQVSSTPLRLLLDLPAASGGTGGTQTQSSAARTHALRRALALLSHTPAAGHRSSTGHRHHKTQHAGHKTSTHRHTKHA